MMKRERVEKAVLLHEKAYGLLRWMRTALRKGRLSVERADEYSSAPEAFANWVTTYSRAVPKQYLPNMCDKDEVAKFVNTFVSYLSTSFELVELEPTLNDWQSCYERLASSPLQTRRVDGADKWRATCLKREYLRSLCATMVADSDEIITAVMDGDLNEEVALATWGVGLVERCENGSGDPALFALWREFAWTKSGSPRKDFQLAPELILDSERRILERIANSRSVS